MTTDQARAELERLNTERSKHPMLSPEWDRINRRMGGIELIAWPVWDSRHNRKAKG